MYQVRVQGPRACFTRPEFKAERMSYDVITPSAAVGILESILWKPQIAWSVRKIHILAPVAWGSVRVNEVASKASASTGPLVADSPDERQQRNMLYLRDVDYVIDVDFELTSSAEESRDTWGKYDAMFRRRTENGQYFRPPVLGMREFVARVELVTYPFAPLPFTRPLGRMLFGFAPRASADAPKRPMFFDARVVNGSIDVPHIDDVLRRRGGAR